MSTESSPLYPRHLLTRLGRVLALALVGVMFAAAPLSAQTTAVREAEQLVAARDYIEAVRVLRAHLAREPGDLDAARLLARALYWSGDIAGASATYEDALQRHVGNPFLRLEFARMLLEAGPRARARTILEPLVDATEVRADARALLGTLYYWEGDYASAARLFSTALAADPTQPDARRQLREIRLLTAPWVRVAPTAWHDDQPLDWQGATIEAGWFLAPLTSVRASVQPRRYAIGGPAITVWLAEANLRHYVPNARLDLELAGGAVQRTIDDTASTAWTGRGTAGLRLPHHTTLTARVERRPYLSTTASLKTPTMVDVAAAELRLDHPRGWMGQAAIERQRYPDDNTLDSAYAWLLAPVARTSGGHLQAGYAFGTEDAKNSRFILDASGLQGRYVPYYTPARVVKHAAIAAVQLRVGSRATLRAGGSYAFRATDNAPVLVPGTVGPASVFAPRTFTPWEARVSLHVPTGERATIALAAESGRGAYYQWSRVGVDVTWRFVSDARRSAEAR